MSSGRERLSRTCSDGVRLKFIIVNHHKYGPTYVVIRRAVQKYLNPHTNETLSALQKGLGEHHEQHAYVDWHS